jgi:hypothetical protein
MSEAPARRAAAATGLTLAAAVALWWLGSSRIALDRGSDASRCAADALQALWVIRGMVLALLCLRLGALRGGRAGIAAALVLVAPAWPVAVLAWSASALPAALVVLTEGLLLAGCAALPWIGQGLRRVLPRADAAELAATALGTALAAAVWLGRALWSLPLV